MSVCRGEWGSFLVRFDDDGSSQEVSLMATSFHFEKQQQGNVMVTLRFVLEQAQQAS